MPRVYFAGICGTFMGSLALIARELGFEVRGCDARVYPPMSELLAEQGIDVDDGYLASHLDWTADQIVIGNALTRGNPLVEAVLDRGLRYTSGPAWLREAVLEGRHVLAVCGTHGKTSTSSMLTWILRQNGIDTGYLIGGVSPGLEVSGRLGSDPCFVIEADEYDTAFFDKRSKFVHYRPRTVVINNLEFDHADIFPDLAAIQRQFHHLVRTIPAAGLVLHPLDNAAVDAVLAQGCWSRRQTIGLDPAADADWLLTAAAADGSRFSLRHLCQDGQSEKGELAWQQRGRHNIANALAAVAAAADVGVPLDAALEALSRFSGVRRRLELLGSVDGVAVYDDFAHHPTAIQATLGALRAGVESGRLIAVVEPRSNSMRQGAHREALPGATAMADRVYWYQPAEQNWGIEDVVARSPVPAELSQSTEALIGELVRTCRPGDHVVIMSNGGFEGIHRRLLAALQAR